MSVPRDWTWEDFQNSQQILLDGQFAESGRFLGKEANAFLSAQIHRKVGDLLVVQIDPA